MDERLIVNHKILSSQTVFKGRFLEIQSEEVLYPDHHSHTIEFIKHPGASLVIPLLDQETVIMVKQYRHALRKSFWEFPAGKKDPGESAQTTAERELKEETGYTTKNLRYLTSIHPVIGYADEEIHIFLAEDLTQGQAQLDSGEVLTVHKVKIAEAMAMLKRGEITDVKTQIGFFWLKQIQENNW